MRIEQLTRPVWVEVNLDHLAHNMREVRRLTKSDALVTAVIKADGYGHGALEIGQVLLDNGADRFAVATLGEGIQLRKRFTNTTILVLGYTPDHLLKEALEHNLIQTLFTLKQAEVYSKICSEKNAVGKIHIKLDTGMHRIGMNATEETVMEILEMSKMPGLEIEGIFTHFAVADEEDKTYTMKQVDKYHFVINRLESLGVNIPIKHVSNSAAIIDLPALNYNMVRAGIMLYGLYPSNDVIKSNVELRQVMSLRAMISQVKELDENQGISYGLKYVTQSKERIATLPLGYADGFTRMLSGKAKAIIGGKIVDVVGRICMDQCMLNVTGIECQQGDVVTLFGDVEDARITIDQVAESIGTINYEIVCMIDKRVPRVYISQGKMVQVKDYLSYID